ncbi:ATP synthase F(0) complex subunit B1, mitochondrial [Strongyloides ratti]|uniref:ATP synthase subunit b n=1 Tax=Strongyloides ratti TaxID=34506 RepID=A0A090LJ99_STRRB|nr:ATP synthase F(0) complex subunit B1, mitochondrial [Strongyloides ratti]CEF69788.1 ATP synthase F(0) complex subunit B1, mitochondrial [Strongyloides ratti]
MSLSRLAQSTRGSLFLSLRSAHSATISTDSVKPEELDNPNFFQKIVLRFKGIPLKGESQRPKCMFDDCDKEWFAPKPLPEMPKDFKEHPDRDLVNYPYPARPMYPPKTRFLVMPNSWFTPFQSITGTSGPYLFFGGLAAFLVNKEIFVCEEQAYSLGGWIAFYLILSRSVGYKLDKWLYEGYQERMNYFKGLIKEDLKNAVEFRKMAAAETESLTAVKEAFPKVMKDNLELQLEATYRKNVKNVSNEIKRRIDYLVESEETKQKFEKDCLIKYITGGVTEAIQKNEGGIKDAYLEDCIKELKNLANKA